MESVDILEKLKRVQNASLEEGCEMSSRRIGDLPEAVSRLVVDDQMILHIFNELVYGKKALAEIGADRILPTLLYRLAELNERSSVAEDFLLREIHRVFRPKQFFTRIWLGDLYMAARLLERRNCELLTPSICTLFVDGNVFSQVWHDVLICRRTEICVSP